MEKPEWEQKLPAGYRMATEADRGTPIGADWKAWMAEWEPIRPNVVGTPLDPWTGNGRSHVPMCVPTAKGAMQKAAGELAASCVETAAACASVSGSAAMLGDSDAVHEDHANLPSYDVGMTRVTIPTSHPWHPKPFTPNKYTRYIPTLDGRKVPVDVYCVSEAFGLSGCLKSEGAVDACNHAKKKLLAPGQRGTKTALQDIKEAHASLARAIELEEAVEE